MILRPTDDAGDVLPVLSSGDLLSGPEAVARLVEYRLSLLAGEWWENPARGFAVLERFRDSRMTEQDADAVSSYITEYIRQTKGVQSVEEVSLSAEGRSFSYTCRVRTAEGEAEVNYLLE